MRTRFPLPFSGSVSEMAISRQLRPVRWLFDPSPIVLKCAGNLHFGGSLPNGGQQVSNALAAVLCEAVRIEGEYGTKTLRRAAFANLHKPVCAQRRRRVPWMEGDGATVAEVNLYVAHDAMIPVDRRRTVQHVLHYHTVSRPEVGL